MTSSDDEENGPIRALVIESNAFLSFLFRIHLNNFGAETEYVNTGAAATKLIYHGKMYDLIVLDTALPDATGVEITGQLRSMGFQSKIVRAYMMYSEHEKLAFMEAGADDYMEKMDILLDKFLLMLPNTDNNKP